MGSNKLFIDLSNIICVVSYLLGCRYNCCAVKEIETYGYTHEERKSYFKFHGTAAKYFCVTPINFLVVQTSLYKIVCLSLQFLLL